MIQKMMETMKRLFFPVQQKSAKEAQQSKAVIPTDYLPDRLSVQAVKPEQPENNPKPETKPGNTLKQENTPKPGNKERTGNKEKPETLSKSNWSRTMTMQLREYLEKHFTFRYNTLSGATEFRLKDTTGSFHPVNEREMNGMIVDARLEGIPCWRNDLPTLVLSSKVEAYNPFHLYMTELPPWDGIDRVTPLLLRVSDNELWLKGGHCWLRAMASQWSGTERTHANALTPILISSKQGLSKSTFCRLLMPDSLRCYYIDNLNLTASTSPEKKLVKNGLINLDEFDKIRESQQANLKNLLQMVNIPIYHGKRLGWVNESRLASFIATTNSYQILTDPTGSRRFLCVEVHKPIPELPLTHKQIYAQLKAELEAGEPDFLNREEERKLQSHNKAFYRQSPLEDVFYSCFRRPLDSEKGIWLTAAEIYKILHLFNPSALKDVSPKQVSLRLSGMGFPPKHSNHGNRYYVLNMVAKKK